jgi:uncharacterized membrane protein
MNRVLPVAFCLISFGLGTLTLGWRSLWGDEAYSVWASQQNLVALFGGIDTQPPLSYVILKVQRALWGNGEFAVRFGSVWFGVLAVAVVFRLAKAIATHRAALLAALCFAVAPIHIYFQQEARMYTLALLLCALSMWQTVQIVRGCASWAAQAAFVTVAIAALYTHFYCAAILAVNAVLWLFSARGQARLHWLAAHTAIAVGFGAWFFGVQWQVLSRTTGGRQSLLPTMNEAAHYLTQGINGLVLGMRAPFGLWPLGAGLVLIGAVAGFAVLWRHERLWALATLAWLLAALGIALATATLVPAFSPRYFIFALLPLVLLWGACGAWGWRWRPATWGVEPTRNAPVVGLQLVLVCAVMLAIAYYGNVSVFDASWHKSGYAQALAQVRAHGQARDGLILQNSDQFALHEYYGPVPQRTLLLSNEPSMANTNERTFAAMLGIAPRIWLLNYGAAIGWQTAYEPALKARGTRLYRGEFGDATLVLYDLAPAQAGAAQPHAVQFGDAIHLIGTRIRTRTLSAGGTLALDLIWRAAGPIHADYTVFVHVREASSGAQIAAHDSPPMNGDAPTSGWAVGQTITDTRGVMLPANAAPGNYNVVVGWYLFPSFARLPIAQTAGETEFVVGQVTIAP